MLVIYARIIWQIYPTLWCCIGFWVVVFWLSRPKRIGLRALLVLLGESCNALATISNGGKMPVLGRYGSFVSVWRAAAPGDHFLILCDRFSGFSIGDILLAASLLLGAVVWFSKRKIGRCHFGRASGEPSERF